MRKNNNNKRSSLSFGCDHAIDYVTLLSSGLDSETALPASLQIKPFFLRHFKSIKNASNHGFPLFKHVRQFMGAISASNY